MGATVSSMHPDIGFSIETFFFNVKEIIPMDQIDHRCPKYESFFRFVTDSKTSVALTCENDRAML